MTNTNKNGLSLSLIHSLHYFILFFLSFLQFIGLFKLHIFTPIIRLVSLSFTVSLSLSLFLSLSSTLYITLSCSLCLSFLQFIGLCRLHIFTLIIRPVSLSLSLCFSHSLSFSHSLFTLLYLVLSVRAFYSS